MTITVRDANMPSIELRDIIINILTQINPLNMSPAISEQSPTPSPINSIILFIYNRKYIIFIIR